jgi:ABC-type sugar transport system ATPase subunit
VTLTGPRSALAAGIAYLSEDRKGEGIFAQMSVEENMNLPVRKGPFVRQGSEAKRAKALKERLGVRATPGQTMSLLSGGNQQKALLARWIDQGIKVLLLDEPTRGIDIGAKKEVYELVFELARTGVAILVVSSELQEILGVSDRVLVMREGRLVASKSRDEATSEGLLRLALPAAR